MPDALLKKETRWTYRDYREWDLKEGERYEIIYGVAYAMSVPNDSHQAISIALVAKFYTFLEGKPCKVRAAPYDVRLFYEEDESDDTVVQPDLTVICDEKKRGYEGCRGAPDLIVEILSPSNTVIEMDRKFDLYLTAGVREYWVAAPEEKVIHVHRFQDGKMSTRIYGPDEAAASDILPGLEVSLKQVFAE
ncbi:MAG: Uma2 family endonuclease [Spirochaetia bacterium]|jgi:Uma2 family endonuclease|nr:Uma2 family endonuclease [Spirochaetia bacterium]